MLLNDSHEASERTQQWREPRARGWEIVLCQIFCRSHFIVCVSWLVILPLPREILNIILWLCIVGGRVTVMARYVKQKTHKNYYIYFWVLITVNIEQWRLCYNVVWTVEILCCVFDSWVTVDNVYSSTLQSARDIWGRDNSNQ